MPFVSEPVFSYLAFGKYADMNVSTLDTPEPSLRFVIDKVPLHIP